jgi:hypothetical protein
MANFKKNLMYQVDSSNIDSVGLFDSVEVPEPASGRKEILVARIKFVKGAVYEYWPCTEAEFEKVFDDMASVKDWFNHLKLTKHYRQLNNG